MLNDLGHTAAAKKLRSSVETVLVEGRVRTLDLGGTDGTKAFTDAIIAQINK